MTDTEIKFRDSIKFITKDDRTLVANTDNSESIFLTSEVANILLEASSNGYTVNSLLESIEDEVSRVYMKKVIERLEHLKMFESEETMVCSDLFRITIDITDRCNLRCKHCCVTAGEHKKGNDLEYSKLRIAVDKIIELNPKTLCISGGEPLYREDFKKIVMYIRENYSKKMILMTNAVLITDENAKLIADNFDEVNISLDGYDEESVAKVRGSGVYEKVIAGINLLKKYGLEDAISLSYLLTQENQRDMLKFKDLCNQLGVVPIYRRLSLIGRAERNINELQKPQSQDIDVGVAPETVKRIKQHIFSCQGGKLEFEIDYRGNLYPCASMMNEEFCLGNIFEISNLKEYLESGKVQETEGYKRFTSFFPYNVPECKHCEYNLFCFSCALVVKEKKDEGILGRDCMYEKRTYSCYWDRQ